MEEILTKIGEFFHSDLILANVGFISVAIMYIINTTLTAIKNKKTLRVEINNKEENKRLDELSTKAEKLEKEVTKLEDMLIVMVRYSRLSDEAKSKIEDIYEGEEDVELDAPEEEPEPSNEPTRTVLSKLSQELDK